MCKFRVAVKFALHNGELSSEAKQLIAQIKLTAKEQVKQEIISEIDLQKNNYNETTKKMVQ